MLMRLLAGFIMLVTFTSLMAEAAKTYSPAKVVYDVSTENADDVNHILDRINLLQNVYNNDSFDASIIVVIHDDAIPLFVRSNKTHSALQQRVQGLTLGEIIQFRLCQASAKLQGYTPKDFDTYIQVVPMADAEIIALQHSNYAYLK